MFILFLLRLDHGVRAAVNIFTCRFDRFLNEYVFYCNLFARLCVYNSVIGYGRKSMEEYGVE